MPYTEAQEARFIKMTETPVPKLVCSLAVPTIISMLITTIYSMVDTFFVGQIGTSATGAVGVVFSLMALIQAVGFTFGNGSGNYISRLLGRRDYRSASRVATTAFVSSLLIGGLIAVAGLTFLNPLVQILGATPTIVPHARAYAGFILMGAPYMTATFVLNNLLRFQGRAMSAMVGISVGAVLNIALDPLFIFVFGLGTAGAALATIISQFVSFCILLGACGRNGTLAIRLRDFTPRFFILREILRNGLPSFYRQGLASVASICLNVVSMPFGDAAIAAMSIVSRVSAFASSALIGFGQGFQPVCGFNYGAQLYSRVRKAFWFCVKVAVVVLVGIAVIEYFYAPQIITLFRKDDPTVVSIGTFALRMQALTLPLMAWVVLSNMMLQTIGKYKQASLLALARQGLFFLPVIWVLPFYTGITGVQISQPIADVVTFLVAIPIGIITLNELRKMPDNVFAPHKTPVMAGGVPVDASEVICEPSLIPEPDVDVLEIDELETAEVVAAEAVAAEVETPEVETAEVETAEVETAEVETAEVETAEVETAEAVAAEVETAEVVAAEVETPEVETPEVETPEVETPEVETAEVETAEAVAAEVETAEVETPEVETPEVETPEVETPEVEAPKVRGLKALWAKIKAKSAKNTATEATSTGVESTSTEVEAIAPEVEATATEVEATATEVEATATEVDATATEVDATATEVDATATEVDATATEVEATATEVETTATEVEAIESEVAEVDAPESTVSAVAAAETDTADLTGTSEPPRDAPNTRAMLVDHKSYPIKKQNSKKKGKKKSGKH